MIGNKPIQDSLKKHYSINCPIFAINNTFFKLKSCTQSFDYLIYAFDVLRTNI